MYEFENKLYHKAYELFVRERKNEDNHILLEYDCQLEPKFVKEILDQMTMIRYLTFSIYFANSASYTI